MEQPLGAHEAMEIGEVLRDVIDGINQFQLYRQHCRDAQLRSIMDNQIDFMTSEYNSLVNVLAKKGRGKIGTYARPGNFTPKYGLRSPAPEYPNTSVFQLDDRDIASGMLGCHKASASLKMMSSLECVDPEIRRAIIQSAINSSEQAYEVWQFMNNKGWYQVPTLQDTTQSTFINTYQPVVQPQ